MSSRLQRDGLPHSDIGGSAVVCTSPPLFAAYRVLRRLREPRHPPCALGSLPYRAAAPKDRDMSLCSSSPCGDERLRHSCRKTPGLSANSRLSCFCSFHSPPSLVNELFIPKGRKAKPNSRPASSLDKHPGAIVLSRDSPNDGETLKSWRISDSNR